MYKILHKKSAQLYIHTVDGNMPEWIAWLHTKRRLVFHALLHFRKEQVGWLTWVDLEARFWPCNTYSREQV